MQTLSIFTTVTDPIRRGDNYHDAIKCYKDLADEVVVVNGGGQITNHSGVKYVNWKWKKEFDWKFIGQQFQRGYEACTSDWVIHADLDFIFHEADFGRIRQAIEDYPEAPGLNFYKYQFILPDRYNLKSRLVIAVNKRKFGERIRFNSGGDLCQPSLDGNEIKAEEVPSTQIPFYNYEKLQKTEAQIREDVGRMARAWQTHFGEYKLGGPDDDSAYDKWLKMVVGRFSKPQTPFRFEDHPKYMKKMITGLQPDQWGFNGFGNLEGSKYVSSY